MLKKVKHNFDTMIIKYMREYEKYINKEKRGGGEREKMRALTCFDFRDLHIQ